jgi:hypothetical protein
MGLCRACKKDYGHWCTSCGWDRDTHANSEGYCSDECLIASGGRTYDQITADDYEQENQHAPTPSPPDGEAA